MGCIAQILSLENNSPSACLLTDCLKEIKLDPQEDFYPFGGAHQLRGVIFRTGKMRELHEWKSLTCTCEVLLYQMFLSTATFLRTAGRSFGSFLADAKKLEGKVQAVHDLRKMRFCLCTAPAAELILLIVVAARWQMVTRGSAPRSGHDREIHPMLDDLAVHRRLSS